MDNNRSWFKRFADGVVSFWNSGWIGIGCSLIIAISEFSKDLMWSGIGWTFVAWWLWAYVSEKKFYNELLGMYKQHLDKCSERDKLLETTLAELEVLKEKMGEQPKADNEG